MYVSSKREFMLGFGPYYYEVQDHGMCDASIFHRYSVYQWTYSTPISRAKLIDMDEEVYAKSKIGAIWAYKRKVGLKNGV